MTYPPHAFSPDSSGQLCLEIRDEDGKVLFRVKAAVLRQLEAELVEQVLAAITTSPRQELEIGGLTIGSVPTDDSLTGTTIENFVKVRIQHQAGPGFRASEADRPALKEALSHYPAGRNMHVIGCYRTNLGGEVEIRPEDRW